MGSLRVLYPDHLQPTVSATPSYAGGSWESDLPFSNVADNDLSLVARSSDTELSSTRAAIDLGAVRSIGGVVIPKHTLSTASYVRFMGQTNADLALWADTGRDLSLLSGYAFARADATTCARYVDRNGVYRTVAAAVLRDAHFISGYRTMLLEMAATNLVLQSEDFGTTWAAVGTPSRSAAAHTAAGVTLDLIGDDDGAALEGYTQTVTFTADAVKAVGIHVKKGSATSSVIRLRDTTAGADRLLAAITWSGVVPTVTMTTGTHLYSELLEDDVYRIYFQSTSVTAANTNSLQVYPATDAALATTATGTIYAGGASASNNTIGGSYVKTTTGTVARAVDALCVGLPSAIATPVAMTLYFKFIERGTSRVSAARLFQIGDSGSNNQCFRIDRAAGDVYAARLTDSGAATTSSSTAASSPAFGDVVEIRVTVSSAGVVQIHQSINGAAEVSGTAGAAGGLPAQWGAGSAKAFFGCMSTAGANAGVAGFIYSRAMAGSKTLAEMQSTVYDSGWIVGWPQDLDAEETDGINVPWVHLLSTAQSARYCSLQIDDYSNADGYIDLARLYIGKSYRPTNNMNLGPELIPEDETERKTTDGGADVFNVKPRRRRLRFTLDHITEAESFSDAYLIQRQAGTSKQLYVLYDDEDSDELLTERSFLGTLEKTSALVQPYFDRHLISYDVREAL